MPTLLPRTLARTIERATQSFPVLLLTGPRQVGKTTVLEQCAGPERRRVTLDDLDARDLAQHDPALFLQRYPPPLLIDEVQYAPQLFSAIKLLVDRSQMPGQFWLTGSQKFHLMQGVSESLAGRVAILDLLGLSAAECAGHAKEATPFLPSPDWIERIERIDHRSESASTGLLDLYRRIWRGSFPRLALDERISHNLFFSSYLQTYVQRDVQALARVGDTGAFLRLVRAAAVRTGQLLNYADLARDVDIDQKTVKAWLGILEGAGLVYLLPPWHSNLTKRLVKTPKLYFLDTGLCAYLAQWTTPEALEAGAMSGAILETYAVAEVLKSYWHNGEAVQLFFYRDRDGREIDLLIERDQRLYPIEIKKTATPSQHASRSFSLVESLGRVCGHGAVLCLKQTPAALSASVTAIPISALGAPSAPGPSGVGR
ncbi:ATP-binding protein [Halochromatium roseum]|uniref:ATP-binding protein n=1 Tax=Halochromatium roseum TaxID=391920 RepID=UPI001914B5EF|nr:ATP-binding protein [Halochromatium roseum]MBK5938500.1 ATPase [Halochromatium roseum]